MPLIGLLTLLAVSVAPVQRPSLLQFVEHVAATASVNSATVNTWLDKKLVEIRSSAAVRRKDFEARNVGLSDGSIALVDLREVGGRSLLVLNVGSGCLQLSEIKKRFQLGPDAFPNRIDVPDGVYWKASAAAGAIYFEVPTGSKCIRTVALHAGL